jgi:hypothetical protein
MTASSEPDLDLAAGFPPADRERWRLAGNDQAHAVVRVVAVDDDGQIHFAILPGSVAKNRHLLNRTVA